MFKRVLFTCVAAVILLSTFATAVDTAQLAASSELSRVTLAVKQAANIGDGYENFNGSYEDDGPVRRWRLSWYGGMESVDVVASDSGEILSYNYYSDSPAYVSYSEHYAPTFPATSKSQAHTAASNFVDRVLAGDEDVIWENTDADVSLGASSYTFDGVLTRNGIPTTTYITVRVRAEDAKVSRFARGDMYQLYVDSDMESEPEIAAAQAEELLVPYLYTELRYVVEDEQNKTAVLRYVPVYSGNYIVDALSGELIDVDEVYAQIESSEVSDAREPGDEVVITEEVEGISRIEGVLSSDALDAYVREFQEIGVDADWDLSMVLYEQPDASGDVFCALTYVSAGDGNERVCWKDIRMNARTTELVSMTTETGETSQPSAGETEELETVAISFARKAWPQIASESALCTVQDSDNSFSYCQNVGGVPFYENGFSVTVDPESGEILTFSKDWQDGYTFEPMGSVVSKGTADAAYAAMFETDLMYVEYPVRTNEGSSDEFLREAAEAGYSYVYELRLAYLSTAAREVYGYTYIYCEVLTDEVSVHGGISYSDLEQSYANEQIATLAEYGIGYSGGALRPRDSLLQLDMLGLLMSATGVDIGSIYDPDVENYIYSLAYGYGMIDAGERDEDAVVTREQFVDCLIKATEYGAAAELGGIYVTGFGDDSEISENYRGSVAIAKALGLVGGDSNGLFNPKRPISRQDAAIVLYKFMSK